MLKTNILKILTPKKTILNEEITKITFKGYEGYVTILPNHINYISMFSNHIITYCDKDNIEKYVYVLDGILTKTNKNIIITTQKAILSDNMIGLKKLILENN